MIIDNIELANKVIVCILGRLGGCITLQGWVYYTWTSYLMAWSCFTSQIPSPPSSHSAHAAKLVVWTSSRPLQYKHRTSSLSP